VRNSITTILLFFTELRKDGDDEYTLRQQMLDAFAKAGYETTNGDFLKKKTNGLYWQINDNFHQKNKLIYF
jgi:hypothetical protein